MHVDVVSGAVKTPVEKTQINHNVFSNYNEKQSKLQHILITFFQV